MRLYEAKTLWALMILVQAAPQGCNSFNAETVYTWLAISTSTVLSVLHALVGNKDVLACRDQDDLDAFVQ